MQAFEMRVATLVLKPMHIRIEVKRRRTPTQNKRRQVERLRLSVHGVASIEP